MSDASPKSPPSRGVSLTTLILTASLTATTTAAAVLAVLYFTGSRPTGSAANVQKDTVKPLGQPAGVVFYEVPYASPPHLTLSAPHRVYRIVKQDEFGFSWEVDSLVEDFVGDVEHVKNNLELGRLYLLQRKPGIEYEDFTFEAKGIPAGPGVDFHRPFEQAGTFQTIIKQQGPIAFSIPYAAPPNVTLKWKDRIGAHEKTLIVECTSAGFKWQNVGDNVDLLNGEPRDNGEVTWTATGLRATKLPK